MRQNQSQGLNNVEVPLAVFLQSLELIKDVVQWIQRICDRLKLNPHSDMRFFLLPT